MSKSRYELVVTVRDVNGIVVGNRVLEFDSVIDADMLDARKAPTVELEWRKTIQKTKVQIVSG